jgi:ankyrin repeat protein
VNRTGLAALVMMTAAALASCRAEQPRYGGARETELAEATAAHDVGAVQRLLSSGADPNPMVRYQGLYHSPWELALDAARPGHPETEAIVHAMLKAGADPERAWAEASTRGPRSLYPRQPLMLAMMHPDPEVVRALMRTGIDPREGETALVMAVENGEADIVHILVERGVNVNCRPGANTPLTAAIDARNVALMTYLEDHGAREKP